ncbi:uncharacterized protein LOC122081776 [Macadamia integrifolia]|uniref:uncharacterized protein LOC122081776 n=1 Tax=Macadamia integrifolia TaxID=60698 RepID=UPI001C4EB5F1|nr:uncharacterized protein LOC122081776 [Macadamia integrifolia]
MDLESATYMLEQLGKTFTVLVSRQDDLEDMVQWKDIEEHLHNLEKSLEKISDELEDKEKAFLKKELETRAFLAERDAVVAVKEQALLDRVQEIKDAAVLTIVDTQNSYKLTSQDPGNKGIFLGCSALASSGGGNGGCQLKDGLSSQRKNYSDGVPKLDAAEVRESFTVDSSRLTSLSQIASHCQSDLSGCFNSLGSLANDQMMTCDVNDNFAGLRKVNAVILNLPQHPAFPVSPTKVKVERPDNDLISPERDGIDSHVGGAPELNIAEVPKSGLTDSGGLTLCSKYASGCQYHFLSENFNRREVEGTDFICSDQMTGCEAKGDSFGPKHVSIYKQNLPHYPTLSTFPTKVKIENCENDSIHTFGDGNDGYVDRVHELNASEVLMTGVSVDSDTIPQHSRNTWACEFGEGMQENGNIQSNQMISYDANGDHVGSVNVDVLFKKLPTFPIKVKVEHSDNGQISQYGCSSGHGDKGLKPDSAEVSQGGNGITVDSMVTSCSQNVSNCHYKDFSGDCSRPGTAANGSTCLNQMTSYEGKRDLVGPREVDINRYNLQQLPSFPTFPVKVKVEYSGNELTNPHEEGIDNHVDGDPELNASPCSQNASECQYDGFSVYCKRQRSQAIECTFSNQLTAREVQLDAIGLKNVNECVNNMHQLPSLPTSHVKVKVEASDNDLVDQCRDSPNGFFGMDPRAAKVKTEINGVVSTDDLDHMLLKDRRNMLLSRPSLATVAGVDRFGLLKAISPREPAFLLEDGDQHIVGNLKDDGYSVDALSSMAGSHSDGIIETKKSKFFSTSRFGSSSGAIAGVSGAVHLDIPKGIRCGLNLSLNNLHFGQEGDRKCSSETTSNEYKAYGDQDIAVNANIHSSSSSSFTGKVKFEVMENGSAGPCSAALGTASNCNMLAVEDYQEVPHDSYDDELDQMILQDRIKLLISRKISKSDGSRNLKCPRKVLPSIVDHFPTVSENSVPRIIKNRRKRKKIATDSVATALEEDAPGLLQVLVEKGIAVDEIKLYGGMEEENVLDDSSNGDNFGELEDVISKVFSQSSSLLKFALVRCTKGLKTSYCLACLISLVEQTRYLQFRKWPVEWGWCRDLQSFIFVFARHNRIVLERPEYGYATYFFELVDSLPIDWQIKRLVTAMKLVSCSRITIIENKPLLVGEDLTEGEARVLEEYGWAPNTGLGSMLNYCDRVVHDSKNEDGSEWRLKIGKFLMDGYNGGTILLPRLPKKAIEYNSTQSQQVMEYMDTQNPIVTECKVSQNPQIIEYRGNQSSHFIKFEGSQSRNIKLEFC